jgi:hypothetical protein
VALGLALPGSGQAADRGCRVEGTVTAHHAGGAPLHRRERARACLTETGVSSFEPTMGLTRQGVAFVNGYDGSGLVVVRSRDRGRSWRIVTPKVAGQSIHPFNGDPYLFVDETTGRVFWSDYLIDCGEVSYSDDQGASWTTTVLAGCGLADHQSVFAGRPRTSTPAGYPNVVYYCSETAGQSVASVASACSKSLDGGRTFAPTGAPAYSDDLVGQRKGDYGVPGVCGGFLGHGTAGADGTVYLPRGWCGQPWLAISKDEGLTWSRVQVASNGMALTQYAQWSHEAGVAVAPDGSLYYVWTARNRLPYLAISHDQGAHWSAPLMVGAPGVREATIPGIDIGDDGRIAIVYLGSTDSPGPPFIESESCPADLPQCLVAAGDTVVNIYVTHLPLDQAVHQRYRNTTWNGYVTVLARPGDANPVLLSARVNPQRDPLARGVCGPDPNRCEVGDFFDVVIDRDGSVWAAMVDSCVATCVHPRNDDDKWGDASRGVVARVVNLPPLRRHSS